MLARYAFSWSARWLRTAAAATTTPRSLYAPLRPNRLIRPPPGQANVQKPQSTVVPNVARITDQAIVLYEAPQAQGRLGRLQWFVAGVWAIYALSMAELFINYDVSLMPAGQRDEVRKAEGQRRGRRLVLAGSTLLGTLLIAIGMIVVRARRVVRLELVGRSPEGRPGSWVSLQTVGLGLRSNQEPVLVDTRHLRTKLPAHQFPENAFVRLYSVHTRFPYYFRRDGQVKDPRLMDTLFYRPDTP